MDDVVSAFRSSPTFGGLSEVQVQDLALMTREVAIPPGSCVFREGEGGDAMYLVVEGAVRVVKRGTLLATLGPGDVLGEMALLLDAPRTASAECPGGARLRRMSRDGFDELLESGDPVAVQLLRNLARLACERLRELDDDVSRRGHSTS